jgi:uncharacterized membrane protein YhaH (DUF805 family)
MFKAPFSFEGRIRRTEYGITMIIYVVIALVINMLSATMQYGNTDLTTDSTVGIATLVLYIPILWVVYAQGTKRCHDLDKSGWWQLIPFYVFVMIFQEGLPGMNQYGTNPKEDNTDNMIDSIGQKEI